MSSQFEHTFSHTQGASAYVNCMAICIWSMNIMEALKMSTFSATFCSSLAREPALLNTVEQVSCMSAEVRIIGEMIRVGLRPSCCLKKFGSNFVFI